MMKLRVASPAVNGIKIVVFCAARHRDAFPSDAIVSKHVCSQSGRNGAFTFDIDDGVAVFAALEGFFANGGHIATQGELAGYAPTESIVADGGHPVAYVDAAEPIDYESVFTNGGYAIGDDEVACEMDAIESVRFNFRQQRRQSERAPVEAPAVVESRLTDARECGGQDELACEAFALVEGCASDGQQAVGQGEGAVEARAVPECAISDVGHRVGDDEVSGDLFVVEECAVGNSGDGAGQRIVGNGFSQVEGSNRTWAVVHVSGSVVIEHVLHVVVEYDYLRPCCGRYGAEGEEHQELFGASRTRFQGIGVFVNN